VIQQYLSVVSFAVLNALNPLYNMPLPLLILVVSHGQFTCSLYTKWLILSGDHLAGRTLESPIGGVLIISQPICSIQYVRGLYSYISHRDLPSKIYYVTSLKHLKSIHIESRITHTDNIHI
jgi:hypothetical protein